MIFTTVFRYVARIRSVADTHPKKDGSYLPYITKAVMA